MWYQAQSHAEAEWGQPSRRKRVPRASKRGRGTPILTVGSPKEYQAKQPQWTCRGPSTDSYRVLDCCFILCECLWVLLSWFCILWADLLVSQTPLAPVILSPPLLQGLLRSAWWSFLEDNWVRHQLMSIGTFHFIDFLSSHVGIYPTPLGHPASSFWPSRDYWAWISI